MDKKLRPFNVGVETEITGDNFMQCRESVYAENASLGTYVAENYRKSEGYIREDVTTQTNIYR